MDRSKSSGRNRMKGMTRRIRIASLSRCHPEGSEAKSKTPLVQPSRNAGAPSASLGMTSLRNRALLAFDRLHRSLELRLFALEAEIVCIKLGDLPEIIVR
jgi:hypothetical protein